MTEHQINRKLSIDKADDPIAVVALIKEMRQVFAERGIVPQRIVFILEGEKDAVKD